MFYKQNSDVIKENSIEKKKSSSVKKIKIDCSLKSPMNNNLIDKNNFTFCKNYSQGKKNTIIKKIGNSPNKTILMLTT